ncbi:hypothetical protein [Pistricoccus aurantiacus]|uniref:hypothetical protein n=1 Tax=Pistricoccus aurantiacus TaxID=1883414 RepID=UPI0036261358
MNILKLALAALTVFAFGGVSGTALSDTNQYNVVFEQGSVLIICEPPEGQELTMDQFNQAFPRWITVMQKLADEGTVKRAHYLGQLKEGVFIVVDGSDRDEAMESAVALSDQLNTIFTEETGITAVDTCEFREIGPVAVLPRQ